MPGNMFPMLKSLDAAWFNAINHGLSNRFFDVIMPLISDAGNGGLIWIVLGLLLFKFGRPEAKKASLLMLLALALSFVFGEEALKHFFKRPRPFETLQGVNLLLSPPHSYSFPSGHAANAFASAVVLARKLPALAWPALVLAVVMAFSRVYVGVHYPLDVIAGSLVGVACALLVLKYQNTIISVAKKIKPPIIP